MSTQVSNEGAPNSSNPIIKPQSNMSKKERSNTLNKMKERWLQIPLDYNSSSFSDFRGLLNKQRILLSDNPDDVQVDDSTLLGRFKQLIGPKQALQQQQQVSSVVEETDGNGNDKIDNSDSECMEKQNVASLDYIRRFWMSDKNCSQCSECGATFHTFRRKHHCRLCGRVFCQTCCSERININKFKKLKNEYNLDNIDDSDSRNGHGNPGMMRVCVFCCKLKTNDKLLGIGMRYPQLHNMEHKYIDDACDVYSLHIKYVIKQLCTFEKLSVEWERLIYAYSVRAADTVFPDIIHFRTDFNDIRHYVKVKRVSGGCISDCLFVDGVICRKNVAHRKMRTDILNPKILLLDAAIEYHRMNSKFHSFDILLKQNEEYMRMIVNKIADLGPDVVVVSNQVSRLALAEMCRENITLICNIDISLMERIARAIGAPIIGSIDHVHQLDADVALGHCGRFHVEYYNCDPVGNKGRRTPLMFFDECRRATHCTILLRGDEKINLLKVKNVMRLSMHTLYHLNFEKCALNDFSSVIMQPSCHSMYNALQRENEKHLFLSTSPFISYGGWRRENVINKLKRLHANKEKDRFPHLQTYPYNHHGIGDSVNQFIDLPIWDPFLPNTDNPWICQTLLVNHCRVINQQQCFPPKLKLIDFYTELDINLGQYLVDTFANKACLNVRCKEALSAHLLTYSHGNKMISMKLKIFNHELTKADEHRDAHTKADEHHIIQWSRCKKCNFKTVPTPMSDRTFCLSFGKLLEMEFYSNPAQPSPLSSTQCKHSIFDDHIKYFAWNDERTHIIEMDSEKKLPFTVFTSKDITTNHTLQFKYYINELNILELVSKYVFAAFLVKIDELCGLIGRGIPLITKDLNDLRCEVNDECEKIATQFIQHRDYLHEYYKTNINKVKEKKIPGTISFLNKKRYHLYRISSEWNELLDGLRKSQSNESNVDNTNRWMKKFKAPFKGLRSSKTSQHVGLSANTSIPSISTETDNDEDDNTLLDAALQEIDDTIANVYNTKSDSGNSTPSMAVHVQPMPNTIANEQNIGDLSFMVNFNKMWDEHLTQNPLNKANVAQYPFVKLPTPKSATETYDLSPSYINISDRDDTKEFNVKLLPPQAPLSARMQSEQAYLSADIDDDDDDDDDESKETIKSPSVASISTQLFPSVSTAVAMPITMQSPSLGDVDMERLKQESLFLVAACTENSSDIGSNPYYAHLNLPKCISNNVIPIYTDEPSAIIAYTLSSLEYHCVLNNIPTEKVRSCRQRGEPSVHDLERMVNEGQKERRSKVSVEMEIRKENNKNNKNKTKKISILIEDELDLDDLLHHIPKLAHVSKMEYLDEKKEYQLQLKKHGKSSKHNLNSHDIHLTTLNEVRNDGSQALKFQFVDPGHNNNVDNNNVDDGQVQMDHQSMDDQSMSNMMEDQSMLNHQKYKKKSYVSTTFSCHVYYPHQFRALRRRLYDGEEDFIESLSRCQSWNTSGGKSGSTFKKTLDHRFVLKFVKQNEFKMFLDNAQSYFEHMASVLFKNYPSVLVHILGVYQISWNKSNSAKSNKFAKYVIVMPNLWYSKNITKQFDLKGSLRNRYVEEQSSTKKEQSKTKTVMLDKNFIEYMNGFPMSLEDQSKQHLHKAVHNDTLFLCRSDVIDYSLLVGINKENNELVVGIIDYLRTYTWDKAVEEQAKSIGMVIGKQAPTIQRPKNYKQRFREAMERYFMVSPDRKTKRINRPKDKSFNDAVRDILIQVDPQS